jgi:hypothetical protein
MRLACRKRAKIESGHWSSTDRDQTSCGNRVRVVDVILSAATNESACGSSGSCPPRSGRPRWSEDSIVLANDQAGPQRTITNIRKRMRHSWDRERNGRAPFNRDYDDSGSGFGRSAYGMRR